MNLTLNELLFSKLLSNKDFIVFIEFLNETTFICQYSKKKNEHVNVKANKCFCGNYLGYPHCNQRSNVEFRKRIIHFRFRPFVTDSGIQDNEKTFSSVSSSSMTSSLSVMCTPRVVSVIEATSWSFTSLTWNSSLSHSSKMLVGRTCSVGVRWRAQSWWLGCSGRCE